jgi:hypothetical protein
MNCEEFRLLGVYRGWRIVRLVSYLIELERKAHANTKLEMESTQEVRKARVFVRSLTSSMSGARCGTRNNQTLACGDAPGEGGEECRGSKLTTLQGRGASTSDSMARCAMGFQVDTLNEALRIAATDIAEAGSADPHMFEGHGGEDDFEEALSSVQAPAISTHTFVVREDGSYDVL